MLHLATFLPLDSSASKWVGLPPARPLPIRALGRPSESRADAATAGTRAVHRHGPHPKQADAFGDVLALGWQRKRRSGRQSWVTGLTSGEQRGERTTVPVGQEVDFGGPSTSTGPNPLIFDAPLFPAWHAVAERPPQWGGHEHCSCPGRHRTNQFVPALLFRPVGRPQSYARGPAVATVSGDPSTSVRGHGVGAPVLIRQSIQQAGGAHRQVHALDLGATAALTSSTAPS